MKNKRRINVRKKARCWYQIVRNHIFVDFIHSRSLEEVVERIELHTPMLKKYLDYRIEEYKRMCRRLGWDYELNPTNCDDSIYWDVSSLAAMESRLSYISDRFASIDRLKWLIELPAHYYAIKAMEVLK